MRLRATKLAIIFAFALASYAALRATPNAAAAFEPAQQRRTQTRRTQTRTQRAATQRTDYTRFQHSTEAHRRACDSCHKFPSPNWKEVRKGDEAIPDVTRQPEHESCLGCHRTQFFARERPQPRICAVCHVGVTPKDQARKPFPNPPEHFFQTPQSSDFASDFVVGFPHDKHLELVGSLDGERRGEGVRFVTAAYGPVARRAAQETDPKSCGVCHQTYQPQGESADEYATQPPLNLGLRFWLKKGTFKTSPNHAYCFTCHSQDGGLELTANNCAGCHKLAPQGLAADFDPRLAASMNADGYAVSRWRVRHSAGAFRHGADAHADLACTTCHDAAKIDMLDPKTTRVSLEACATCHVTESSDEGGALNVETDRRKANASFQCTKCHVVYGRAPVPETHAKAVAAAK
ncbi:MAG TPA: cytochrome c3 family protein [Pyrinomonadaceae bacterium]|nr:cytochrome c3 family protein [Pyrinomonadaceae bacterium]